MRANSVLVGIEELGDPEIEQLRDAVGGDQDVARLEVAVDDQVLVGEVDRRADLPEELAAARWVGSFRVVAILVDRLPLDVLHDEVGAAVLGGAAVEQLGDVRVVEVGEDLALGAEAADDLVRVHAAPDELEGDLLLELLVGPLRQVDRAHAAPAELAHHPVGADALAGREGYILLRADPEDGRFNEVAELGLGGDEGFHFAPQLVVPFTGDLEESRPFGLFPIQGALEDDFDLLPALRCHESPGAPGAPIALSVFLKRERPPGKGSLTRGVISGSARGGARASPSSSPA